MLVVCVADRRITEISAQVSQSSGIQKWMSSSPEFEKVALSCESAKRSKFQDGPWTFIVHRAVREKSGRHCATIKTKGYPAIGTIFWNGADFGFHGGVSSDVLVSVREC